MLKYTPPNTPILHDSKLTFTTLSNKRISESLNITHNARKKGDKILENRIDDLERQMYLL